MSELIERVGRTIAQRRFFQPGEAIVVAVSGGLDSMVLLDALHRLARRPRWRLVVAHFNHQLRGAESDGDERFVQRAAQRLGLEFVSERWPVTGRGLAKHYGEEMAARLARHDFLARAAGGRKISTIALAHHAEDQAELFFLRLFRGAGGDGLAGMRWEGPGIAPVSRACPLRLVRPFLELCKVDLRRHARKYRIRFREDSSNASPRHARNRIRNKLLPLLARDFEPAIVKMVARTMDLAGTDADFARREAERWLAKPGRVRFERLHPAVQRQCLRLQMSRLLIAPTYDLVEHLRLHPHRAQTSDAGCALSRDEAGRVSRIERLEAEFNSQEILIDMSGRRGCCRFGGVDVGWDVQELGRGFRRPAQRAGREYFDAGRVGPMVTLRHWREGDRFQPIGMEGAVKLQDLFVNLKIPRPRRHQLLVAATRGDEIWWVENLRIGERFKVGPGTKRVLAWQWGRPGTAGARIAERRTIGR